MAKFNPDTNVNLGDNYTGRSERSRGNGALGSLFSGIADSLDQYTKYKNNADKKALDAATTNAAEGLVSSSMNPEADPTSAERGSSYGRGGNPGVGPDTAAVPAEITAAGDSLARWHAAFLQGKVSPVRFEMEKAAIAKGLKSQYSQFDGGVIDSMLNQKLSVSTANDFRLAQEAAWAKEASTQSDEVKANTSFLSQNLEYLGNETVQTAYKSASGTDLTTDPNTLNKPALMAAIALVRKNEVDMQHESANIALAKGNRELQTTLAIDSAAKSVNRLQQDILYNTLKPDMTRLESIAANGKVPTNDEMTAATAVLNSMQLRVNQKFEDMWTQPDSNGNSYASIITDKSKKEELRAQLMAPLQNIKDAWINGDTGIVDTYARAAKARKDYADNEYLKATNGGTQMLNWLILMHGGDAVNKFMNDSATGEYKKLTGKEAALYDAMKLEMAGGLKSVDQLVTDVKARDSLSPETIGSVPASIQATANYISGNILNKTQSADLAIKSMFGPDNKDFLEHHAAANPMAIFNLMVNPEMANKLKGTAAWDYYSKWAFHQAQVVIKPFADVMIDAQKNTAGAQIQYNEQTGRFDYTPGPGQGGVFKYLDPSQFGFGAWDAYQSDKGRQAVDTINQYLTALQPILEANKATSADFLAGYFKSSNFQDMKKDGGLLDRMSSAVSGFLSRGGHMSPENRKIFEDLQKTQPKAGDRPADPMSGDQSSIDYKTKVGNVTGSLEESLGIPRVAAAGIVGNLIGESNLNPRIPGDGGAAHGWAQWNGPRKRDMLAWTKQHGLDPGSDQGNYAYLVHDLTVNFPDVLAKLKKAKTVTEATDLVMNYYEFPGIPRRGERLKGAARALASN